MLPLIRGRLVPKFIIIPVPIPKKPPRIYDQYLFKTGFTLPSSPKFNNSIADKFELIFIIDAGLLLDQKFNNAFHNVNVNVKLVFLLIIVNDE